MTISMLCQASSAVTSSIAYFKVNATMALSMKPLNPDDFLKAANDYISAEKLGAAKAMAEDYLKRDRQSPHAKMVLGMVAHEYGLEDEAIAWYDKMGKKYAKSPQVLFCRARVRYAQGRTREALKLLNSSIDIDPALINAHLLKLETLERSGDLDAARAVYEKVPAIAEQSQAKMIMARIEDRSGNSDQAIELLDEITSNDTVHLKIRRVSGYYKAKVHDAHGRYEDAWAAAHESNQIRRFPFDRSLVKHTIDDCCSVLTAENMKLLRKSSNTSELPVFIAGLPRSGTTLLEQIIDAHPEAAGIGELNTIDVMADMLGGDYPWPGSLGDIDEKAISQMARKYIKAAVEVGGKNRSRLINKNLQNWNRLPLVAMMFPNARVIHIRRDPRDVAVSCFMSSMHPKKNRWTNDVSDILWMSDQCERLMTHWKSALDLQFLEVNYEDLVHDVDVQARRVIDFLGLPWNDQCLSFHRSGRTVMTLSYDQVNKPIYSKALGRYRNYESFVPELKDFAPKS
jgi:tetratricopeptide (TPR) repeat protein